ncbi:MAG TPA: hypothetical protein VGT24_08875 [Candidatus Acidoferrales bacterium]|nr:hypothetical protein [Candidatus Acidoferrales bacterium]
MDPAQGRRRSQRLFVQAPVNLEGRLPNNTPFDEPTQTIVVNAHGALVEARTSLNPGQILTLRNTRTNEVSECVVKIVTPAEAGKFHVALEFTGPNPKFWHIAFPPEDWNIRHPDAKKGI